MNNCLMVPIDESHRSLGALDLGQTLASQMGLNLLLLSVVDDPADIPRREQAIRRAIDNTRADITVVAHASVAKGLLGILNAGENNVCCMATHARGAVSEMVLGSVARQIVQEYRGMVILVGPRHPRSWAEAIRTVLVCVDGSALSEQALAPAAEYARLLDARLQLVQVLDPASVQHLKEGDSGDWVYLRALSDRLQNEKGIAASWDVLHGTHPGHEITAYADAEPGSLIVLSTHGRSGLTRLAMGSVAQHVVHISRSPVSIIPARHV